MYDFFKGCTLENEEDVSEKRVQNIKAAVLSRIEEEKTMKHFTIKPFIIAAAITAGTAASLVTANAATGGAIMDGIHETITFLFNGKQVEANYTSYTDESGGVYEEYEFDVPDDGNQFGVIIEGDSDLTLVPIEN